jgi:lysophospholipid acyltransferase (LPLAT)-like uncharacterized protein
MLKRIAKSRSVRRFAGRLLASWLQLVRRTNRFVVEPANAEDAFYAHVPVIVALWHGQHFMGPYLKRPRDRVAVMISRHGDGEINAAAAEAFGFELVRGSGAQRADQIRKRGGAEALRGALAKLKDGCSLVMTADVPKVSRVAGDGVVTLAQLSGRPVVPVAVVTSRRLDFKSWDRSSMGLPFGRGAIVTGEPIHVPRDASNGLKETLRQRIEAELDRVHARAYALVEQADPGAGREDVRLARQARAVQDRDLQERGLA